MPGPTWAVSPSMVCLPHNTRPTSSISACSLRIAAARTLLVARVSAPPKTRSESRMAVSTPKASAFLRVASALGGPMEMAATLHPKRSFKRSASSRAWVS